MLIYDVFHGQTTERFQKVLFGNNFVYVSVLETLADKFPPLHLNINSFAKSFLNRHFQTWYSDEIRKKTDVGENVYEVHGNTRLLRMKPTQSCQIISICNKLRNSEEMIQQVFKLSTTKEEATKHANFGEEDPFYHSLHLVIKKNLRKERPLFHCFFRILHFIEKSEIHTKFNQGESRR